MWQEDCFLENLAALFYFVAFIVSLSISITFYKRNSTVISLMYLLLSLGLFFIAMEEISWGQRIFNVNTPALFSQFNAQDEITIHNIRGFPLHSLYIIVGLYGAFGRFIIPNNIKNQYGSIVNLFSPNAYLFFYFFIVGALYLYYEYFSSILVALFGDQFDWSRFNFLLDARGDHFMHAKDQEPAEFLLSLGFLLFVTINKYRQYLVEFRTKLNNTR
jgi:hypothetical protein